MRANEIAAVAHEANRVLQLLHGDPRPSPHWEDAHLWQTDSAVDGVNQVLDGATPETLHQAWVAYKLKDGWTYGPFKDAEAKTHPCLVAYDQLEPVQRTKDRLFVAIVNVLKDEPR